MMTQGMTEVGLAIMLTMTRALQVSSDWRVFNFQW